MSTLKTMHAFLARHLFYPLLLATGLMFFFFFVRLRLSGDIEHRALIWNLFLAWLPYWFSLGAKFFFTRPQRRWALVLGLSALWLFFLPNAPYILTDFIHLEQFGKIPWWYDIGLIATAAFTGLFLGIISIRTMHEIAVTLAGKIVGWLFALTTIALSGLGVYLGRFLRWNSWDLLASPNEIVFDVLHLFRHPIRYADKFGFIFMFTTFTLIGYLLIAAVKMPEREEEM